MINPEFATRPAFTFIFYVIWYVRFNFVVLDRYHKICYAAWLRSFAGVEDLKGRSVQGLAVDSWKLIPYNRVR
jgi:hypothetical protein